MRKLKDLNVEYVIEEMLNEINDTEVIYNLKRVLEYADKEKLEEKKKKHLQ